MIFVYQAEHKGDTFDLSNIYLGDDGAKAVAKGLQVSFSQQQADV